MGRGRGVEDDCWDELLEAHIGGAVRQINGQITELVFSYRRILAQGVRWLALFDLLRNSVW